MFLFITIIRSKIISHNDANTRPFRRALHKHKSHAQHNSSSQTHLLAATKGTKASSSFPQILCKLGHLRFFFFLRIHNIAILSLKIKFYEIVSYVKVAFVGCFSVVV